MWMGLETVIQSEVSQKEKNKQPNRKVGKRLNRYFSKGIQMVKKCIKRCSTSLIIQFSSVQSLSCVNSFWPHESQHTRPPCPSPTPRVYSNSHPSSRWCYPVISCFVVPFSSRPQSFPASEFFPMSQLFAWGGQSIGVLALTSVLPINTQDWSPL